MKIAVMGLALSHPEAFSVIARERGVTIDCVWDGDRDKADAFARRFDCAICATPEEAVQRRPDGALITCISADHGRISVPFLDAGIPVFVDKPFAVSRADLDLLCEATARTGTPLASCSALRYARDHVVVGEHLRAGRLGTILGATATVCHPITGYLKPGNTWQDEIALGGGSIINMGIHGVEPLVALFGPAIRSVCCFSAKRFLAASQSEDIATIALQWRDGTTASVQVVCGSEAHGYDLIVYGSAASVRASAPSMAVQAIDGTAFGTTNHHADYGYVGTVEAMCSLFERRASPIPLEETRAIILTLLAARQSSAEGRIVTLD
jgi:predicted dehydrogenase